MISPADLQRLLRYEPETGRLFWRDRTVDMFSGGRQQSAGHSCARWNSRYAGRETFKTITPEGYHVGTIWYRHYRASRVIWTMVYSQWPEGEIDHIDGNRHNNRLDNLRDVTSAENKKNSRIRRDNMSGTIGVSWCRKDRRWKAFIHIARRCLHIGNFLEKDDAIAARRRAEVDHGFHPNHGRPRAT